MSIVVAVMDMLEPEKIRIFVGLDGEMTGSAKTPEFFKEYQLCQIGLALGLTPDKVFESDIGYDEYSFTQTALDVNGFTHDRIRSGPKPEKVDAELVEWLHAKGIKEYNPSLIAVGWNVGAWDLAFVRYYLPRFSKFLSYRTVDLNAVTFAASFVVDRQGLSYYTIKTNAKRYAEERLKVVYPSPAWHSAGFDAAASLAAFEYLIGFLKASNQPQS